MGLLTPMKFTDVIAQYTDEQLAAHVRLQCESDFYGCCDQIAIILWKGLYRYQIIFSESYPKGSWRWIFTIDLLGVKEIADYACTIDYYSADHTPLIQRLRRAVDHATDIRKRFDKHAETRRRWSVLGE